MLSTALPPQLVGINNPSKSPRLSTALVNPSTSSRAKAKLMRLLSKLGTRDFASLGSLMPRLRQSKTTQWWAFTWQILLQKMHKQGYLPTGRSSPLIWQSMLPACTRLSCALWPSTLSPPPRLRTTTCSLWECLQWLLAATLIKLTINLTKTTHRSLSGDATVDGPIGILFGTYLVVPFHNFKLYISHKTSTAS